MHSALVPKFRKSHKKICWLHIQQNTQPLGSPSYANISYKFKEFLEVNMYKLGLNHFYSVNEYVIPF